MHFILYNFRHFIALRFCRHFKCILYCIFRIFSALNSLQPYNNNNIGNIIIPNHLYHIECLYRCTPPCRVRFSRRDVANPNILGAVRRVHRRHVAQQVPTRLLGPADGHVRVQLGERVVRRMQTGPLVRHVLVDADGRVRPGVVVHRVPVPDRRRVRVRAQRVPVPGHHPGVRGVLAAVGRRAPAARRVHADRGGRVPGRHRARQRRQRVLPVQVRARLGRVVRRLPRVHVRPEPEHVLRRDAVRRAVFQGVHQVSRRQRRPEAAQGRKRQPLRVPVHAVPGPVVRVAVPRFAPSRPPGRGAFATAAAAVRRHLRQRLLPGAAAELSTDGQRGRTAEDQTLARPPVDRRAQQPVRRAHGTVRVLSVAHGPVQRILRDVLRLSVGTVGLLLATAVHAETVDDHFDGALYDETGKTHNKHYNIMCT